MAKLNQTWVVQPHKELVYVCDGIMSVEGSIGMPLGKFPRRMTVLALKAGGSAIWSAIPLNEQEMKKIDSLGPVHFIIVPNAGHRLDLGAWVKRYPGAQVIAPPDSAAAVGEAATVNATSDIVQDPAIHFGTVNGMKLGEFFLTVSKADGTTLILNDILANVRHPEGLGAQVMARLFGFGVDRPRCARLVRARYIADKAAVAQQFRSWAEIPGLARIIVSHGDMITAAPRDVLVRAAEDFE